MTTTNNADAQRNISYKGQKFASIIQHSAEKFELRRSDLSVFIATRGAKQRNARHTTVVTGKELSRCARTNG